MGWDKGLISVGVSCVYTYKMFGKEQRDNMTLCGVYKGDKLCCE